MVDLADILNGSPPAPTGQGVTLGQIMGATPGVQALQSTQSGAFGNVSPLGRQMPEGTTVIGTFPGEGEIYLHADGSMGATTPGMSTSDPALVERFMQGDGYEQVLQQQVDNERIGQAPIVARASEVAQGIPFAGSWLDEAVGVVDPTRRDNMRGLSDAMGRQHPGQTAALNLTGGVLGSIPMAMAAAPTLAATAPATIGGKAMQATMLGAGTGATEGLIYGAGEGETADQRTENALTGAAWGAGLGGVLGGVSPYAGASMRWTRDLFRRNQNDIGVVAEELGISEQAASIVRDALDTGDDEAVMAALQRAGPDAMLADAGTPAQALLDATAQAGGQPARIVGEAMEQRLASASSQVTATLDRFLGAPRGTREILDEVRSESRPILNEAYTRAYSQPIDYSAAEGMRIQSILDRIPQSDMQAAIRFANDRMRWDGGPVRQIMAEIGEDGAVSFQEMPNVMQLDYIKRGLDAIASDGTDAITGQMDSRAALASNMARTLREATSAAVPEYRDALATGADAIARRSAVTLGRNLFRANTTREDVARALHGATDAELGAAREGLRSAIDDALANVTRTLGEANTDPREAFAALRSFSSRANQDKIEVLLGADGAAELLGELDQAATTFELRSAIAQNSATARRQSIQSGVDTIAQGSLVRTLASGEPVNATKRFIQALTGETPEAVELRRMGLYEEIATALTSTPTNGSRAALRRIQIAMQEQRALTETQARLVAMALDMRSLNAERVSDVLLGGPDDTQPQPQR